MLFVRDIMSRKLYTVNPTASVKEAASIMSRPKIGSVIVTEGTKQRPLGIVTEGDISRAVAKGRDPTKVQVRAIMSKPLITISSDLKVEEAARIMTNADVKKLPVIEKDRMVGIITQTDIVGSSFDLVTALKEMVRARYRPPDFQP
jgi:CBS domain-containing protein